VDYWEESTELVWHNHGLAAKRLLAEALNCEFNEVNCQRTPEFDEYASTEKVPDEVLLNLGWWLSCRKGLCSNRVTGEERYTIQDGQVHCENCSKPPTS